jgi:hypothetical protein
MESRAFQVSQRALVAKMIVHMVISNVKDKLRILTRAYKLRGNGMVFSYRKENTY